MRSKSFFRRGGFIDLDIDEGILLPNQCMKLSASSPVVTVVDLFEVPAAEHRRDSLELLQGHSSE